MRCTIIASCGGERNTRVPLEPREPIGKLLPVADREPIEPGLHPLTVPIESATTLIIAVGVARRGKLTP